MLLVTALLLTAYFIMDSYYYRKEGAAARAPKGAKEPLKLDGIHNFLFLAGIVGAVLLSGAADWGQVNTLDVHRGVQDWVRDGLLVLIGALSLATTRIAVREDNNFTWAPIVEVGILFVGIFITMLPCLLILKAGPNGAMAFIINAVTRPRALFLGRRGLVQLPGQCPHLPDVLQHRPGQLLPGGAARP